MSDIPTPAVVVLVMVGAFIIVGVILWVADIMAGPCDCGSFEVRAHLYAIPDTDPHRGEEPDEPGPWVDEDGYDRTPGADPDLRGGQI